MNGRRHVPAPCVKRTTVRATRLLLAALAAGYCLTVSAHGTKADDATSTQHAAAAQPTAAIDIALPDAELVTQYGAAVKLKSEVIGERIVVMDFVYTTCTTVCPVVSAIFGQVQSRLGDRLGREVVLVSISVDPARDTPRRLKAYAAKYRAREGWVWLTGRKHTVDALLRELGAYSPSFEDHPSMVLVGDPRRGQWARFLGFPSPEAIVNKVNAFSERTQAAATKEH